MKKNNKKVYCCNCKLWSGFKYFGSEIKSGCMFRFRKKDNDKQGTESFGMRLEKDYFFKDFRVLNKNNDCPYYSENKKEVKKSWWKKLIAIEL